MRKRLIPAGKENRFQKVKRISTEAQDGGVKLFKLSIGQPSGPAILQARMAAAEAVMSRDESMHEYQDNGCPGVKDFGRRFVQCHVRTNLSNIGPEYIDYLPIPGIKPMLQVVEESIGSWLPDSPWRVAVGMTEPGYPTPKDQAAMVGGLRYVDLNLEQKRGFLFEPPLIENYGELREGDLLMLNFPHNPTGIIPTFEWLDHLCSYCEQRGIRIFNDGAYYILDHSGKAATLTDVALKNHPNLNWAEAFSASKAGNFTGWRVGAMCGSPEFMADIRSVKGNVDSGLAAPLAAGIIHLFEDQKSLITDVGALYARRLHIFKEILRRSNLRISVNPEAGFFVLCDAPTAAFGERIDGSADEFMRLLIEKTGIVSVPFGNYTRFAICAADVEGKQDFIAEALGAAKVEYERAPVVAG